MAGDVLRPLFSWKCHEADEFWVRREVEKRKKKEKLFGNDVAAAVDVFSYETSLSQIISTNGDNSHSELS